MKVLIFIRDIFKKYPVLLIAGTGLVILVSLLEACSLFTIGPLVDFFINRGFDNASTLTRRVIGILKYFGISATIMNYLWFFIAIISISSCLRILARFWTLKIKYIVCRDIMLETFKEIFQAKWYFFSSHKQGMLLNAFTRELQVVGDTFGALTVLFGDCIRLIFFLVIPFVISWQVTIISLVTAFFLAWPFLLLNKVGYRLGKLNTSTANEIVVVMHESFGLAKDILGFGNQHKAVEKLADVYDAHAKVSVRSQTINQSIGILYRPFGVIVLVVAFLVGNYSRVAISETAVLLLGMLQAVISIGKLMAGKNSLDMFFPSYEQLMNLKERAKELKQHSGMKEFAGFKKEIAIEHLTFSYPGHDPVLRDICIVIPKGKMVAIVGASGAGKSTLIDMIMGLNESLEGKITFDGNDLYEFDINSYRGKIGYVPQDTVLFNISIRDNLLWANDKANMEEIRFACHLANADEFIEKFPHAYDTIVGDRGVRLSGGQRQRIALARAVLRKPELLFLDEATSSLDTHSERLIQQSIEAISKETTVIVIAHRLSTIINADYIYVLKDGIVIEEGAYQDLLRLDSHFNRMVKLQLLEISK